MLNRRTFLKYVAMGALGMYLNPLEVKASQLETVETIEPMIYKSFLKFSSYERRLKTEILVIHHTEPANTITNEPEDRDSTAEKVHKWHIEHNGWSGIGYHYLIRKDGMIEEGRPQNMIGAHVLHHNDNTLGICLAGNFNHGLGNPTEAQMQSLKDLTVWLCRQYNLNPSREGVILGHRDLNDDTTCPGDNLYCLLNEVRDYCKEFSR